MKILGHCGHKQYLCQVSHDEIEKVLGKYFGDLPPLTVGQVVKLDAVYDLFATIKILNTQLESMQTTSKHIIETLGKRVIELPSLDFKED